MTGHQKKNSEKKKSVVVTANWFRENFSQDSALYFDPSLEALVVRHAKKIEKARQLNQPVLNYDYNYLQEIFKIGDRLPEKVKNDFGRSTMMSKPVGLTEQKEKQRIKAEEDEFKLLMFVQISPTLNKQTIISMEDLRSLYGEGKYPDDLSEDQIRLEIMKYFLIQSGVDEGVLNTLDEEGLRSALVKYGEKLITDNPQLFNSSFSKTAEEKLLEAKGLYPSYSECSYNELRKFKRYATALESFVLADKPQPVIEGATVYEFQNESRQRLPTTSGQLNESTPTKLLVSGKELRDSEDTRFALGSNALGKHTSGWTPTDDFGTVISQSAMTINAGDTHPDIGLLTLSTADVTKKLDRRLLPAELFNTTPPEFSDTLRIHHKATIFSELSVFNQAPFSLVDQDMDPELILVMNAAKEKPDVATSLLQKGDIIDPFPICSAPTIINSIDYIATVVDRLNEFSIESICDQKAKILRASILEQLKHVSKRNLNAGQVFSYELKRIQSDIVAYLKLLPSEYRLADKDKSMLKAETEGFETIRQQLDPVMMFRVNAIRQYVVQSESVLIKFNLSELRENTPAEYKVIMEYMRPHLNERQQYTYQKDVSVDITLGSLSMMLNQMKVDSADFYAKLLTFDSKLKALESAKSLRTAEYDMQILDLKSQLVIATKTNPVNHAKCESLGAELGELIIKQDNYVKHIDIVIAQHANKKEKYQQLLGENKEHKAVLLQAVSLMDGFIDFSMKKLHELSYPTEPSISSVGNLFSTPQTPSPLPGPAETRKPIILTRKQGDTYEGDTSSPSIPVNKPNIW